MNSVAERLTNLAKEPVYNTYSILAAIAEIQRLEAALARANRIAHAADRMADAIRKLQDPAGTTHFAVLLQSVIDAADAYDLAMSDPAAEATDG